MSLTSGRGPLGSNPQGWFVPQLPPAPVLVEPHGRRVQAIRGGDLVIDTERALLVHRVGRPLTYAFPAELASGLPCAPVAEAPGYVTVPWDAVDSWSEEGRQLMYYPPNPYHRVDCRPTRRRLRVTVGDVVLVDTDSTLILFETSLAPVLYVDPAEVRTDLLERSRSGRTSYCNYKGSATYWSARIGPSVVEDVAWSYENPLPESVPLTAMLSFDGGRTRLLAELPAPEDP